MRYPYFKVRVRRPGAGCEERVAVRQTRAISDYAAAERVVRRLYPEYEIVPQTAPPVEVKTIARELTTE